MKRYSIGVDFATTLYVLAETPDDAVKLIEELVGTPDNPASIELPADTLMDERGSFLSAAMTAFGSDDYGNLEEQAPFDTDGKYFLKPYTVIVRHPDYLDQNDYGGTGQLHTMALDPDDALANVQAQFAKEHEAFNASPSDWAVVSIFEGHLESLAPIP